MTEARTCPECGRALPKDAPEGLCPKCLLHYGLKSSSGASASGQTSTAAYRGGFAAPSPEELAARFPQLEILELLGQGGMGAVYKARQPGLDRLVALKILPARDSQDPAFAERFSREARALAKLNHPNIVAVYDFGQADGLFYFVMEYVDGVNLRQTLQAGHLQPQQALKIVPQICAALQFAHDEGIVHRDIKPENLLLDKKGRLKIADFGLAKLLGQTPADAKLTATHQVMGTPHYMAPEQVERPLEVDHRADIYSLGVVFYEMLTGELPLGRFAPPSQKVQVDVRLDEVVLKTLEKEPARRYQHISEIKTAVESIGRPLAIDPRRYGYEYRSNTMVLGWPLLHIATGIDPATGRKRIAKGIIAIGDLAIGGFAMGGGAIGIFALGGSAFGLISLGGLSIGLLLALGGGAIGGIAIGGAAIGIIAVGGGAVGYYALGGGAWGVHALGANADDPVAFAFYSSLAQGLKECSHWIESTLIVVLFILLFGLDHWIRTRADRWGPWWLQRSPFAQKLIKTTLLVMLLAGGGLFLSYSDQSSMEGGQQHSLIQIGSPDPWFNKDQHNLSSSWTIRPITWSFLAGIVAYLALYVSLAIHRIDKQHLQDSATEPADS